MTVISFKMKPVDPSTRVWSGGTYDGHQVVFCDQGSEGIIASLENGRVVARTLGGTFLSSSSHAYDLGWVAVWLDSVANSNLGEA